jgi:hypothetical protein
MSGPDLEIEERLRRLGPAFKDGIEPPATLHVSVMADTTAPRRPARRPSMLRELSLAAALIAFVALLAFGFSRLHSVVPGPVKRSPSPSPVSRVVPWVSTTPTPLKLQTPKTLTADQAAQDVRQTVTDVTPVLLPSAIPSGFQAQLYDDSAGFSAVYVAADGRKITFSIVVPNPPPGTPNVRQSQPMFRGVRADYQVDDATVPTSPRWLIWNEPGTPIGGQPGVPYFFTTEGFTESEFWTIANSIGPIPAPVVPPTCRLADLYTVSTGGNGATGHVIFGVGITNHGGTPCSLTGFPGVSLVTAQGTVVSLREQQMSGGWVGSSPSQMAVLPPNQIAPAPHTSFDGAYFNYEWYYCGSTPPQVRALDLILPGSTASRRVPLLDDGLAQGPSRCDDPSQGRTLLVGPIQGPNADSIAVTPPALRVALAGVPDTLVAGQTLRYEVTITNDSAAAILFDTCPVYDEGFTPDLMVSFLLNCGPVGRLDAGASATFAMELTVRPSPKAPLGPQKFLWRLHGFYAGAQAGKVVTVSAS